MNATKELSPQTEQEPISSFVLTWDVIPLVNQLCLTKGWKSPSPQAFQQSKNELTQSLTSAFGESRLILIDADNVNMGITNSITALRLSKDLPVVTMDPIYGANVADLALNTTRGLISDGKIEEIARPGYPEIKEQIEILSRSLNGNREVYLVDAGVFSGESLRTIISLMRKQNIEINRITLGFATREGQRALWDLGIQPSVVFDIGNPIDWIESRDFIPFTPLSGRVLKGSFEKGKLSTALPYILPEGDPSNWASIPTEFAMQVSLAGWNTSEIIMKNIQANNGITLRVDDFVDLPVRVSYPGKIVPGLTDILDIIAAKKQALCDIISR